MTDHPCTCAASRDPYKLQHSPECPWQPMSGQQPADALYNRATGWNAMHGSDVANPRETERLAEVAASEAAAVGADVCVRCKRPERAHQAGICLDGEPMVYAADAFVAKRANGKTPAPFPAVQLATPARGYGPERVGPLGNLVTPAGIAQAAQVVISERERPELEQLRAEVAKLRDLLEIKSKTIARYVAAVRRALLAQEWITAKNDDCALADHLEAWTDAAPTFAQRKAVEDERDALRAECEAKASAIADLMLEVERLSAVSRSARMQVSNDQRRREDAERRLRDLEVHAAALRGEADRQAREASAPASAESARETPRPNSGGIGADETTAVLTVSPRAVEGSGPRKGEPAAEVMTAEGGALTAKSVVSRLRQEDEVLPGFLLGNDKALALVAEYGRQRSVGFIANLNVQTQTLAQQLGERDEELAQLRAQLAQRPDARLREAVEQARRYCSAALAVGGSEEGLRKLKAAMEAALADPAPQVEREALPTLAANTPDRIIDDDSEDYIGRWDPQSPARDARRLDTAAWHQQMSSDIRELRAIAGRVEAVLRDSGALGKETGDGE